MHDARIGRFFAIDPLYKKYPFYSPYAFSGNRVIDAVEQEGLQPTLYTRMLDRRLSKPETARFSKEEIAANSILIGFTPAGVAMDIFDLGMAIIEGDATDVGIAMIGFLPFGDFAKMPGKLMRVSSEVANARHVAKGWDAPYKVGSEVLEFTTSETEQFVRVFKKGDNSAEGAWMMKKSDLLDADGNPLSAAQIQDKFSLDYLPDNVVDVNVPANTKMITGTAAARKNVGNGASTKGGGQQYELDQDIESSNFTNSRSLEEL